MKVDVVTGNASQGVNKEYVSIGKGGSMRIVVGINNALETTQSPDLVIYKQVGSAQVRSGTLNQKMKKSFLAVYELDLTYDELAAYVSSDESEATRSSLQLNGILVDPNATLELRNGTTNCVVRISFKDIPPFNQSSSLPPAATPTTTNAPVPPTATPAAPPAASPPLTQNIIDTSSYWPQRGKSYLYKGTNNVHGTVGRTQLDVLPANVCGTSASNYRFTKSNPDMYWNPCVKDSCKTISPNTEMVFMYEPYLDNGDQYKDSKSIIQNRKLIDTMTLAFATRVQPKGEKGVNGYLADDATQLSNTTYGAFTKAQYDFTEANYKVMYKNLREYSNVGEQPYEIIYSKDSGPAVVGYPFLPRLFDLNHPQKGDVLVNSMYFFKTENPGGSCDYKVNAASKPLTRTDEPSIPVFKTQYVNYSFPASREITVGQYTGRPLIVSMHEMYKGCDGYDGFESGGCVSVLREDWYLAPGIGLVRLEQKYMNIYGRNTSSCGGDNDCKSRVEMKKPDFVMELINYGDTPPAAGPVYNVYGNMTDSQKPIVTTPPLAPLASPPTTSSDVVLKHRFWFNEALIQPYLKIGVGILKGNEIYHCVRRPSKEECKANYAAAPGLIEEQCGNLANEPTMNKEGNQSVNSSNFLCKEQFHATYNNSSYYIIDLLVKIDQKDIPTWEEGYQYDWGRTHDQKADEFMTGGIIEAGKNTLSGYPRQMTNDSSDFPNTTNVLSIDVVHFEP